MHKSDAIVLRVIDFSETSCVVTLLTREFGKITGLAKGARRKKNPFESALDLLAIVRLVFWPKAPRAMDLLTEAKLERRFRAGGKCLRRLYCAYYVAEIVGLLVEHNDPMPSVYDLTEETIRRLDGGCDPDWALFRFEMGLLNLLGHRPQLDACIGCGRPRRGNALWVAFAPIGGGTVCPACRVGQQHVLSVRTETIEFLNRIGQANFETAGELGPDPATVSEAREVLNHYVSHVAGREPRTQRFLKSMRTTQSTTRH